MERLLWTCCAGIRSKKPDQPVLMVAGANVVEDRVRGLDAGADDYVAKPFEVAELAARIRAVVRRNNRSGRSMLQVGDLELDRISHSVQRHGHTIDLSPKEFSLLELLMRHAGQPVSRPAIVEQVWKLNLDTMTNVVDVYINYLRRKVDAGYDVALIRTIRGVGYQIGANTAPCSRARRSRENCDKNSTPNKRHKTKWREGNVPSRHFLRLSPI